MSGVATGAILTQFGGIASYAAAGGGRRLRSAEHDVEFAVLAQDVALPPALILPAGLVDVARYQCELVTDTGACDEPCGAVMLVAFDVPEDRTHAVDDWYDQEHIELLMRADGWLRARRYRVVAQEGRRHWTSLAFHELRDVAVMDSQERAFARSTAWRAELEKEAWFPAAGRWVYLPA